MIRHFSVRAYPWFLSCALMALAATISLGQKNGEFPLGSFDDLEKLPPGRFKNELRELPPQAQQRARAWLRSMHFTEGDAPSMHADSDGGICFACHFQLPHGENQESTPETSESDPEPALSALPVAPFPESLKFSSRPGATNIIYLNFGGQVVEGTQWNTEINRASIPARPFSTDTDFENFSASEQVAIKRIWQRMAEDFAPFNVNVTTERPPTITNRTAVALITRSTDANGAPNPFSNAAGVAYVNVFGRSDFASRYSPAWIYHNNLSNNESLITEAASHEIGHNLGLSHDGLTTGAEYYGGHGSGEISWATIMGTGFNRNVSQWSKGEYLNANNTQDDLAVIAGKLGYRPDDHGNTPTAATPIIITNGNQITSTNLENDPANTNPANKGLIERTTDVDVFSFINGDGPFNITASPWVMPSGTRGGNLDILLELRDDTGQLIATSNPPTQTGATISTTLAEGRYFLSVKNSGAGNPFASPPTGYTVYGSLGTYYLSGSITAADGFNSAPIAQLQTNDITISAANHPFTVTYSDNSSINVSTIASGNIRVLGHNGYNQPAQLVSIDINTNGSPRIATYSAPPPTGSLWTAAHNGNYEIFMGENQVADIQGAFVPPGQLGEFQAAIPVPIYSANMDANPGWTLESGTQNNPGWQYGPPNYSSNGPIAGHTGTNIIGYNLSGNYSSQTFAYRYATTPPINVGSSSNLTLQFRRWLRLNNNADAHIQFSTNGTTWTTFWTSPRNLLDNSWQLVQYALPASAAGSSSLRIRWGITKSGGNPQSEIGWNIDDFVILGDGAVDTDPPLALLNVADITQSGSPGHSCSVTFSDETAVRLSSLNSFNLVVTGPNGYTTLTTFGPDLVSTLGFIGADLPVDGSPITASYDIPAPDNQWQAANNGTYTITLREGTVTDTLNNAVEEAILGTFEVAISEVIPGELTITPGSTWEASGKVGGPFEPGTITFTLGNTGASVLDWTANKTAPWFELNTVAGTIQPGQTIEVIASLNAEAEALPAGDYSDFISFVNISSGVGNTARDVILSVAIANTPPRFGTYNFNEDGVFVLNIVGGPGDPLIIEWSEDLIKWEQLLSTVIGLDGTLIVQDPESAGKPERFYRIGSPQ